MKTRKYGINPLFDCFHASYLPILMEIGTEVLIPKIAYEEADNGVRSAVHWDMVMRQTRKHGGGEIHFDGTLVRKDGKFVHPALEGLNPGKLEIS